MKKLENDYNKLSKANQAIVMEWTEKVYNDIKDRMHAHRIRFENWKDLSDDEKTAWCEYVYEEHCHEYPPLERQ